MEQYFPFDEEKQAFSFSELLDAHLATMHKSANEANTWPEALQLANRERKSIKENSVCSNPEIVALYDHVRGEFERASRLAKPEAKAVLALQYQKFFADQVYDKFLANAHVGPVSGKLAEPFFELPKAINFLRKTNRDFNEVHARKHNIPMRDVVGIVAEQKKQEILHSDLNVLQKGRLVVGLNKHFTELAKSFGNEPSPFLQNTPKDEIYAAINSRTSWSDPDIHRFEGYISPLAYMNCYYLASCNKLRDIAFMDTAELISLVKGKPGFSLKHIAQDYLNKSHENFPALHTDNDPDKFIQEIEKKVNADPMSVLPMLPRSVLGSNISEDYSRAYEIVQHKIDQTDSAQTKDQNAPLFRRPTVETQEETVAQNEYAQMNQ